MQPSSQQWWRPALFIGLVVIGTWLLIFSWAQLYCPAEIRTSQAAAGIGCLAGAWLLIRR